MSSDEKACYPQGDPSWLGIVLSAGTKQGPEVASVVTNAKLLAINIKETAIGYGYNAMRVGDGFSGYYQNTRRA